ncbi:hypothetical protein BH24CHL7_BH24CHL7_07490 [soil metagenome]
MEQEQQPDLVGQFFDLLSQVVMPDWVGLIALLPLLFIGLVVLYLAHTAWQWRRAGACKRLRVPTRLAAGAPPAGIHLPGPSRWPFVVPIGAALLLFAFALPARDEQGNVTSPFNMALLSAGLLVTVLAVAGWLFDAMREWRATAQGGHGGHDAALTGGHVPALLAEATAPALRAEPPPGVHMPGPSPWPFFAPIAVTVMLFGVIFSSVLIVGGLILAIIAAAGWYRDAGKEYFSTEAVGHAVPETRDPVRAWPGRLVPVFATVIAFSLLITLAPIGLGYLNSLTPPKASPTPVSVPAVPEVSASDAVSFNTSTLIVPAGRDFELVFNNNNGGVPHNVEIAQTSARDNVLFEGEIITGVATATYQVPALAEGSYYFLCTVHPNMNGSVQALPETGAPAPGGSPETGAPAPGGSPAPGASPGDPGQMTSAPQASPAS